MLSKVIQDCQDFFLIGFNFIHFIVINPWMIIKDTIVQRKNLVDVGEGLLPQTLGHRKGSQLLPHVLHLLLQLLIPGPELCVFLNISNYNTIVRMFCLND